MHYIMLQIYTEMVVGGIFGLSYGFCCKPICVPSIWELKGALLPPEGGS